MNNSMSHEPWNGEARHALRIAGAHMNLSERLAALEVEGARLTKKRKSVMKECRVTDCQFHTHCTSEPVLPGNWEARRDTCMANLLRDAISKEKKTNETTPLDDTSNGLGPDVHSNAAPVLGIQEDSPSFTDAKTWPSSGASAEGPATASHATSIETQSTLSSSLRGSILWPLSDNVSKTLAIIKWHMSIDREEGLANKQKLYVLEYDDFDDGDILSSEELEAKRDLDRRYDWAQRRLLDLARERREAMKSCASTGCCSNCSTCASGLGDAENWYKIGDSCIYRLCTLLASFVETEGTSSSMPSDQTLTREA